MKHKIWANSIKNVYVCYLLFCLMAIGLVSAQEDKTILGSMAEYISVAPVSEKELLVRESVTAGAGWLLALASEHHATSLFIPPQRQYRAVDVKTVEIHYRKAVRQVPVYEYKEVKAMMRNDYGEMVAVMRRRPIRQIGTKSEEYLVQDDNGSVVHKRELTNAWDKDDIVGPAFYYGGVLGQNGMCLYALSRAGVPMDMGPLPKAIDTLKEHLIEFGLPDRTWDLAWLTAGFANLPAGYADDLKQRLANKLLLAQIDSGSGKGMWGPFCVNQAVAAAMVEYEQKTFGKALAKLKSKQQQYPDSRSVEDKLDKLDGKQKLFANQYKDYTRTWIRPHPEKVVIEMGDKNDVEHWIRVRGMPHFFYGESLGDLESTSLSLFALNEAKQNGCLPDITAMPKNESGRNLIQPIRTSTIIANAVRTLGKVEARNGSWSEANSCSPITAFDRLGFVGLPVKEADLPKLKSKITTKSTVDGYAALCSLSSLSGGKVSQKQLRASSLWLAAEIPAFFTKSPSGENEIKIPYQMAMTLSGVNTPAQTVSSTLVGYLLSGQANSWGRAITYLDSTSSLSSFFDVTPRRLYEFWHQYQPARYPEFNEEVRKKAYDYKKTNYSRMMNEELFCTASAVAYLSGSLQVPTVGVWGASQGNAVVRRMLGSVRKSAKLPKPLAQIVLPEDLAGISPDLPVIYVSGQGKFDPGIKAVKQLKEYLTDGGLLVSSASGASSGLAFLDELEKIVIKELPESKIKIFPVASGRIKLKTVIRKDGTIAMLSFPVAAKLNTSLSYTILNVKAALRLMSEVLKVRLGPERLNSRGVVDLMRLSELQQELLSTESE